MSLAEGRTQLNCIIRQILHNSGPELCIQNDYPTSFQFSHRITDWVFDITHKFMYTIYIRVFAKNLQNFGMKILKFCMICYIQHIHIKRQQKFTR